MPSASAISACLEPPSTLFSTPFTLMLSRFCEWTIRLGSTGKQCCNACFACSAGLRVLRSVPVIKQVYHGSHEHVSQ